MDESVQDGFLQCPELDIVAIHGAPRSSLPSPLVADIASVR